MITRLTMTNLSPLGHLHVVIRHPRTNLPVKNKHHRERTNEDQVEHPSCNKHSRTNWNTLIRLSQADNRVNFTLNYMFFCTAKSLSVCWAFEGVLRGEVWTWFEEDRILAVQDVIGNRKDDREHKGNDADPEGSFDGWGLFEQETKVASCIHKNNNISEYMEAVKYALKFESFR